MVSLIKLRSQLVVKLQKQDGNNNIRAGNNIVKRREGDGAWYGGGVK